jgi:repressor LexA
MAQRPDDSHDAKRKVANRTELSVLRAILDHTERGEQIINLNQLAKYVDRTKSVVSPALDSLEDMGFITSVKTDGGKRKTRTIRVANAPHVRLVPILGRVAAGQPILADLENVTELVPLPSQHIRGINVYMLKVRGESMIGDGILDGDYVIVDRDQEVKDDEIGVVLIGEEAAIKHVWRGANSIRLVSSNPAFDDQNYDESDFAEIQGKVLGVVRWLT